MSDLTTVEYIESLPSNETIGQSLEELTKIRWTPIILYLILFILGGPANLIRFINLFSNYSKISRFHKIVFHLIIADLIVTWIMIPTEIIWRLTNIWYGGDVLCRVLQMLKALGLYLSSFVLVCISIDRYFAVAHPLDVLKVGRRNKILLLIVWIMAIIFSLPQVGVTTSTI